MAQSSVILWSGEDTKLFIKGDLTVLDNPCCEGNVFMFSTNRCLILFICRYASLYFCMCIDQDDNELEILEIIHHFVEILDRYFGSVSILTPNNMLNYCSVSSMLICAIC